MDERYAVVDADVEVEFLLRRKKTGELYPVLASVDEARRARAAKNHPERCRVLKLTYKVEDVSL